MRCEMCSNKAEVEVSWLASAQQKASVCECCAAMVWDKLSREHSGTPAFSTFTVLPIGAGVIDVQQTD